MYYNTINMMSNHGIVNSIFNKSKFIRPMERIFDDCEILSIENNSKCISPLSYMALYELNAFKRGRFRFIRDIKCRDEINSAMCIEDISIELENATQQGIYAYYSMNDIKYK